MSHNVCQMSCVTCHISRATLYSIYPGSPYQFTKIGVCGTAPATQGIYLYSSNFLKSSFGKDWGGGHLEYIPYEVPLVPLLSLHHVERDEEDARHDQEEGQGPRHPRDTASRCGLVHFLMSTVHCLVSSLHYQLPNLISPLSTVHCPMPTVNCQLSTVNCPVSSVQCPVLIVVGVVEDWVWEGRTQGPRA